MPKKVELRITPKQFLAPATKANHPSTEQPNDRNCSPNTENRTPNTEHRKPNAEPRLAQSPFRRDLGCFSNQILEVLLDGVRYVDMNQESPSARSVSHFVVSQPRNFS